MTTLWTEKYRPKHISDYVWRDENQKKTVEAWVNDKNIPHILLSGTAGIGKSSLVNVLLHEIGIDDGDILEINASEETSIDTVREKIINFASTIPFGDFKVCILEEADALSRNAQNSLKRVTETYSENCRFIFTTNNPNKIDPALHSRCQTFHMTSLNEEQFLSRMMEILDDNNIEYDPEYLLTIFKATYPDLRKAINTLDMYSKDGKLMAPGSDSKSVKDYIVEVTDLFRKGKIQEGRTLLVTESNEEDYVDIFRFLYRNLDFWSDDSDVQDEALIIIKNGLVNDGLVADREINLSATLAQLKQLTK